MSWRGCVAAMAAALWVAPEAGAQTLRTESPRSGALRFKVGGYDPRSSIDSESGLTGNPFEETFGRSSLLLFELEFERYLWQGFGAFGLGLSAGYAEKYGRSIVTEDPSRTTSETTALQVLPVRLYALYNFDYPVTRWRFPLVPYAKGGVGYMLWRITKGGKVEVVEGVRGQGGKWALTGAVGLAFLLDVLEQRLAADFDSDVGVNHSYVFGEYNVLRTDLLFGNGGLNLSSQQWMFGLAFEF
jgi:hypothetical protein